MKPLVVVLSSMLISLCTVLPSYNSVKAAQQCDSCTGSDCWVKTVTTKPCNRSCFTIELRQDSPDETDPFVVKGCTSDLVFMRRTCGNKCYDDKREFGSSMYYICVYCCTGDKCNQDHGKSTSNFGSKIKDDVILTTLSVAIAVTKLLFN